MALVEARGPDEGSMTVIFGCSDCGRQTAMLTNAMETQVVRSLGVKIGGDSAGHEPMEMVRGHLTDQREAEGTETDASADASENSRSGSACPFTETVEGAFTEKEQSIQWTAAARERLNRIPSMARPMARRGIEDYARENGYSEITEAVMDSVKGRFNM
jgi:hypothetical protein